MAASVSSECKVALISGASSGIGYALCGMLLASGFIVYGISRRGTVPDGAFGLCADVTKENELKKAVDTVKERSGRIDLLVTNAGFGISGPIEFTSLSDAREQMDVNFFGQYLLIRAVLPLMREQGSGHIVCVSSVAAQMAIPYQSFYSASKSAVNALALSLRNEVRDFGIKVTCVMPGDAKTGFTDARRKDLNGDSVYPKSASAVTSMEKDERSGMSADDVASVIVKAAFKTNPAPLYIAGPKYKLFCFLFRILPYRLAYAIIGSMYS